MTGALAHPKRDLATAERELSVPKVAGRAVCPPLQNPPSLLGDGWRPTALTLPLGEAAHSMCRAVRLDDEGV